jgi:hypothetical protein
MPQWIPRFAVNRAVNRLSGYQRISVTVTKPVLWRWWQRVVPKFVRVELNLEGKQKLQFLIRKRIIQFRQVNIDQGCSPQKSVVNATAVIRSTRGLAPSFPSRACASVKAFRASATSRCAFSRVFWRFFEDCALPWVVRGPVERVQGFHERIKADCRSFCSWVHRLAMIASEKSSLILKTGKNSGHIHAPASPTHGFLGGRNS